LTIITNQFRRGIRTLGRRPVNLTTKSGTNDVHGTAHWFTQNRNLNAADNLIGDQIAAGNIPNKPRFDHNDLGATIGGPLVTDKLFFFGAYNYNNTGQLFTGPTNIPPTSGWTGHAECDRGEARLYGSRENPCAIPRGSGADENCAGGGYGGRSRSSWGDCPGTRWRNPNVREQFREPA